MWVVGPGSPRGWRPATRALRGGGWPSGPQKWRGVGVLLSAGPGGYQLVPLVVKISRASHTAGSCPCPFLRRGESAPGGEPRSTSALGSGRPLGHTSWKWQVFLGARVWDIFANSHKPLPHIAPSDQEGAAEQSLAFCPSLEPLWPAGARPSPPPVHRPQWVEATRTPSPVPRLAGRWPSHASVPAGPPLKGASSPAQFHIALLDRL